MLETNCKTFTKIQLSAVSRMLIFLLLIVAVMVLFLHSRTLQPSLMGCPGPEALLQPKTGFEVCLDSSTADSGHQLSILHFEVWFREQQERRAQIARVCSQGHIKTNPAGRRMFNFNEEHRLLFCFQQKVREAFLALKSSF